MLSYHDRDKKSQVLGWLFAAMLIGEVVLAFALVMLRG